MDNHVHLLVWLPRGGDMARFMQQVNLTYSLYFKKTYGYCGHLWRDRFQSKLIEHDSYLLQCGYYIETNPVRAGIAAEPERYEFSSYRFYCYGQDDKLVTCNPLVKGGMLEYRFCRWIWGIIGKVCVMGELCGRTEMRDLSACLEGKARHSETVPGIDVAMTEVQGRSAFAVEKDEGESRPSRIFSRRRNRAVRGEFGSVA
jgi:hypothetical protein